MSDLVSGIEEASLQEDVVVVGDREIKIGKPTPKQAAGVARAFARLNLKARGELASLKNPNEFDYIMAFVAHLDEETLIDLAALAIGTDKKFATENFDLVWVTQALIVLIRKADLAKVIANFTSMLSPNQT